MKFLVIFGQGRAGKYTLHNTLTHIQSAFAFDSLYFCTDKWANFESDNLFLESNLVKLLYGREKCFDDYDFDTFLLDNISRAIKISYDNSSAISILSDIQKSFDKNRLKNSISTVHYLSRIKSVYKYFSSRGLVNVENHFLFIRPDLIVKRDFSLNNLRDTRIPLTTYSHAPTRWLKYMGSDRIFLCNGLGFERLSLFFDEYVQQIVEGQLWTPKGTSLHGEIAFTNLIEKFFLEEEYEIKYLNESVAFPLQYYPKTSRIRIVKPTFQQHCFKLSVSDFRLLNVLFRRSRLSRVISQVRRIPYYLFSRYLSGKSVQT